MTRVWLNITLFAESLWRSLAANDVPLPWKLVLSLILAGAVRGGVRELLIWRKADCAEEGYVGRGLWCLLLLPPPSPPSPSPRLASVVPMDRNWCERPYSASGEVKL